MVKRAREKRHPALMDKRSITSPENVRRGQETLRQKRLHTPIPTQQMIRAEPALAVVQYLDQDERDFLGHYLRNGGDINKALGKVGKDDHWYLSQRDAHPEFREALETLGGQAKKDAEDRMAVMTPWATGELRSLIAQDENPAVKLAAIKYLHEATGVGEQHRMGLPGQGNYLNINVKVATGDKEAKVIELGKEDA